MHRAALLFSALLLLLATLGCDKARSDSVRLTNEGMKALNKNELRIAKARFQEALDVFPDNSKAHYGMGVVMRELKNPERSRRHFKAALDLEPDLTEALFHLGQMAFDESKLDEAEGALRRVLEQDPDDHGAYFLLGQIHENRNALKDAEVAYRKAVTLSVNATPFRADVFVSLARLYERVGAEEEAMAVLREGMRVVTPERVLATSNLAVLYNALGRMLLARDQYGQAIDVLRQAVQFTGAPKDVAFNLGWAYAAKGDPELALKYFSQFIALAEANDPAVPIAVEVKRHLQHRLQQIRSDGKAG